VHQPTVGQAARTRTVTARDVDWSFTAPVRPGDDITAEVEVLESRADKPITTLRTTITRADGAVALQGTALVWREGHELGPGR
jgi:3-hydroxymyristoyl/3-hydroxydecanoyl-(acyl carrier protein) dehydratase